MKVVFVEPPKQFWFVMGEYLPPPTTCLQLAAYLETKRPKDEITVIDCQAENLDWKGLERKLESIKPDIVAVSSLSTCNTYTVIRALETSKKAAPEAKTITGGQHFTALAEPSLKSYPVIDAIARGEGEITLTEFVDAVEKRRSFSGILGLSYRHGERIISNPPRPLIENLDELPMPGYRFVEDHIGFYHFEMMAKGKRYLIVEGSRGCDHSCNFCTQCAFWENRWRSKSGKRIADEMEHLHNEYGAGFLWLTDDNFTFNARSKELVDELNKRRLGEKIVWFVQARVDDVARNPEVIPEMRRSGNQWILLGVESGDPEALAAWRKGIKPGQAKEAIRILERNDIFSQATMIIGNRKDTHESIESLRRYIDDLNPGLVIFMVLTPYPGTELYEEASRNGWIQDTNWANYDMIHAVMPTETLTVKEVQEELYRCYRSFYGRWSRRFEGIFSNNKFKRRTYRYMVSQNIVNQLYNLF